MFRRDFIRQLALVSSAMAASPLLGQTASSSRVMLGIDVLEAEGFAKIKGLRAGLVTHPAGVNRRGEKTIDVLRRAPGVKLVKLFGPEHGIYGDAAADVPVQNSIDRRTGIPVFSLYGKTRKPTPDMLTGLDVMLVDLQDIGSRSYTYVSCMRNVLEACYDAGIKVMILDRPNPLGGLKVDGPGLDKKWMSYVGYFQVPYVHGLTIGELAMAATRTYGWLNLTDAGRKQGQLEVIRMAGWTRSMRWRDTGLNWVATSPMVRDIESAEGYPITGLGCQLGGFSHGMPGGYYPFRSISFSGKKAEEVRSVLAARRISGLGLNIQRLRDGTEGIYLAITDWDLLRPTEISFHMMQLACLWSTKGNPFLNATNSQQDLFNKHTGCEAFFNELQNKGKNTNVVSWINRWTLEAEKFREWSKQHWLYGA
ncbi:MAG: DUF1343 domain-containing protein [Puniceicoccales bacterium]|jgi:uncharacterized protein YbbC (DUF1343 family)|nr:DUF1343 domain-containing protein [Puniceicoccales bacterium]